MKEEEQCQTSHLLWKIIGNESKSPGFYNVVVLQFMQLQCIFFCFIFAPLLYLSIYQHPTGRLRCQKLERKSQGESIRPKKRELHELPQNGLLRTVFVPLLFTYCTSIHAYQAQTYSVASAPQNYRLQNGKQYIGKTNRGQSAFAQRVSQGCTGLPPLTPLLQKGGCEIWQNTKL